MPKYFFYFKFVVIFLKVVLFAETLKRELSAKLRALTFFAEVSCFHYGAPSREPTTNRRSSINHLH